MTVHEHALYDWPLRWRHVATLLRQSGCHGTSQSYHTMIPSSMIYCEYTQQ